MGDYMFYFLYKKGQNRILYKSGQKYPKLAYIVLTAPQNFKAVVRMLYAVNINMFKLLVLLENTYLKYAILPFHVVSMVTLFNYHKTP